MDFESLRFVPWGHIDPFYAAVAQAVEEAVLNALVANEAMIGRDGHRVPALPRERLLTLLGAGSVTRSSGQDRPGGPARSPRPGC